MENNLKTFGHAKNKLLNQYHKIFYLEIRTK